VNFLILNVGNNRINDRINDLAPAPINRINDRINGMMTETYHLSDGIYRFGGNCYCFYCFGEPKLRKVKEEKDRRQMAMALLRLWVLLRRQGGQAFVLYCPSFLYVLFL
jgi:hypothetical protein